MYLSKTRYCKGIQCPKMLWMDRNMSEKYDESVINKTILTTGSMVGDLAMGYFGDYSEVPYSEDKSFMLKETQHLMKTGTEIIAEAAFSFKDNICIADILRRIQDGYELIEVKSSIASSSEGADTVDLVYLHDMAFQTFVLMSCGLIIKKVSLMRLNRDYVRKGNLDIQGLFVLTDCSEQVFAMQGDIADNITDMKAIAQSDGEPDADIGSRCDNPYECRYKGWCFRHLPPNNVFNIGWGMRGGKKDGAYYAGYITFEDVQNSYITLTDKQKRQIVTVVQNLPPQINEKAIKEFLSSIRYPLYHLDFETFHQVVPQWNDLSPYTQIPFQYSLHIQEKPCGEPIHKEFLAKEGTDPRREIAERLCADIPADACVIAYSMSFEKGRVKELSALFPDLAEHLTSLNKNMIDLAFPFQSGAYYCREMGGSYSIKTVLPALCPNDPELDYKGLSLIHNGNEAMDAYPLLHIKTPKEIAQTRAALLAYCRLDTLAMVKILEKLYLCVSDLSAVFRADYQPK